MMGKAKSAIRRLWNAMAGLAAAVAVALLSGTGPAKAVTIGKLAEDGATQIEEAMVLMEWVFYALAVFVAGWAILRFKTNLENQQRGGLALPVVGILVAVGLASAPALIDAVIEGIGLDRDPGLQKPKFQ